MANLQQRPPSPPLSGSDDPQFGLHHIANHNAMTPHTESSVHHLEFDAERKYQPLLAFNGPNDGQSGHPIGRDTHNPVGLGIQGSGYPVPKMYSDLDSEVYGMVTGRAQKPYFSNDDRFDSPYTLTPNSSVPSNGDRRTRANRFGGANGSPSSQDTDPISKYRIAKPSRKGKPAKAKLEKDKVPKLTAPLSELTKDMNHVPVGDTEAWVNRPAEERLKEAEKRKGHIARPMNSFMLYRSAYADRTKVWCLQNNHQVVSSVSGVSWRMEPEQIREKFNELARIERVNHQKAHPNYKFTPGKGQPPPKKRNGNEQESDEGDEDFDWTPKGQRKMKQKRQRSPNRSMGHRAIAPGQEVPSGAITSSYHTINPGRPLPAAMDHNAMYGQYYQTMIQPHAIIPNTEDVTIRKTDSPGAQFPGTPPVVGLPGLTHYDLMQQPAYGNSPASLDGQLDPTLLAWDENFASQGSSDIINNSAFGFDNVMTESYLDSSALMGSGYGYDGSQGYQLGAPAYPQYSNLHGTDGWRFDRDINSADAGSDFDKWMEDPNKI